MGTSNLTSDSNRIITTTAESTMRVLLCAPGENLEGGIGAVVKGLEAGFQTLQNFEWKRILYAKPKEGLSTIARVFAEIKQLGNYLKELIQYQPSVVLVETSFDKKTVVRDSVHLLIAKVLATPFILHAHGGEWHLIAQWGKAFQFLTRYFLMSCSCIIVTSEEERLELLRQFGETVAVRKIRNPLLIPTPQSAVIPTHQRKTFVIVFASRLIESKGIMDAVEAMSFLKEKDVRLDIYGNGIKYEDAKGYVAREGLEQKVFFKGQIPLSELLTVYANCDAYLFPSYHLEGFPMALFYAVAMGAPIIATKVRPLPEYLQEPENCLWIEPKNPMMLAQKISLLIENETLRRKMSEGNKALSKKFVPSVVIKEFLVVFEKNIGENLIGNQHSQI